MAVITGNDIRGYKLIRSLQGADTDDILNEIWKTPSCPLDLHSVRDLITAPAVSTWRQSRESAALLYLKLYRNDNSLLDRIILVGRKEVLAGQLEIIVGIGMQKILHVELIVRHEPDASDYQSFLENLFEASDTNVSGKKPILIVDSGTPLADKRVEVWEMPKNSGDMNTARLDLELLINEMQDVGADVASAAPSLLYAVTIVNRRELLIGVSKLPLLWDRLIHTTGLSCA